MRTIKYSTFLFFLVNSLFGQLPLVRDTITVIENGYVLKMPWANGLNYVNMSSIDVNRDGKKDLVAFDRLNQYSEGRFRCFINTGLSGQKMYRADTYLSYLFPKAYNWAVFIDYNNDGKEDLFTSGNSNIIVYKNTSTAGSSPSFSLEKSSIKTDISNTSAPVITSLFASIIGVPGFADLDGDGDLDILSFSPQGTYVEFHKNLSVEKYGVVDSLEFKFSDNCWGNLAESNCGVDFNLCNGSSPRPILPTKPQAKELHAGSCLTCMDSDGDLDTDLLMGDISCNLIQYVHNAGTLSNASFNDTTKIYPNYNNANTTPIRINNFPCTYYLDVDGDGKKDLLASPNSYGSENFRSLWYYKNTSSTPTVNFSFVQKNFLQDEMIEVGQNSFPVVFDFNNDGKKDLLIGTYGYYLNNSLSARLTLYQNTGTLSQPTYSLVSKDYAGLSSVSNVYNVMPTAGDVDGDGDIDICIGTSSGQIHWFENTAGAGNVCNFSVFKNNPFQFTTNSAAAAPQLFDLDGDGKLDLLIGTKNGRIAYYQNTSINSSNISFALVTNTLGDVLVTDDPLLFGYDGYAAPYFYKDNGSIKLLVGSVSGKIIQYSVPSNVLANYTIISQAVNGLCEGSQSTVCYEDVNNDGKRDLFVGNASGGLTFFTSNSPLVGLNQINTENLQAISIYPNPSSGKFTLNLNGIIFETATIEIQDLPGKCLVKESIISNQQQIDVSELTKGIYVVKISLAINSKEFNLTKKFIKE